MAGVSELKAGLRVVGRAIRDEQLLFWVSTVGSAVFAVSTVGYAYVVGAVVGRVAGPAFAAGHADAGAVALGAAAILAVVAIRLVGIFARRLAVAAMQYRLQARYRRAVTRRYLSLPLAWHYRHATGSLLSNANADVEAAFFPMSPLPLAVGTLFMLVAALGSFLVVDWTLALVGLAIILALFAVNIAYSRSVSGGMAAAQAARAELSAVAHESIDAALVVKTLGREDAEAARLAVKAGELRDWMVRVGRVRGLFDPLLEALPSLGSLAMVVVGAVRVRQGGVTLTDLVGVTFLFTLLAFPIRAIGVLLAELPTAAVGWERVRAVLDAPGDMTYGPHGRPDGDAVALRVENAGFSYPDGPRVLSGVSFEVPAGRTVALVGSTGSGKSTIAALAGRLFDPADGHLELDGVDLREFTAEALTSSVGLVLQVPFIFDDSIRANVALDRAGIDDEAVWAALRAARAEDFVRALPGGLSTVVGERGTTLSGGQRQRLALARALAGRPRLLVLDDATSALDPRVEAEVLAGLRGRGSLLVVAHRWSTIALADTVVYLKAGRVAAAGTHDDLLATVAGYADLVTAYGRAEEAAAGTDPAEAESKR